MNSPDSGEHAIVGNDGVSALVESCHSVQVGHILLVGGSSLLTSPL